MRGIYSEAPHCNACHRLHQTINVIAAVPRPMIAGLDIPTTGDLDFLALGALVHRFDPGLVPFRKATTATIHVSGGEFNTAANLADCFQMRAGIATAMVDYPIGDLVAER